MRPYTAADTEAATRAVLPDYVTAEARDAYEFAPARPDILQYLPCYCGCGPIVSHTSELDYFIDGIEADGTVRFDDHGYSCHICVQIARDAERLLGEGKTLSQVRAYIEQAYSEKGPATNTPWPPH